MGIKRKIGKAKKVEYTLREACEAYIEEKKALNQSPATIESAEYSVNMWIDYLVYSKRSIEASTVDMSYILAFTNYYLDKDMKPTTLNHYLRDIRAFVYWCQKQGYITSAFKIKLVTQQQTIKETYSDEECMKLLARPHKNASYVEWRSWAIVNWILATGHRASTVVSITLGALNFRKGEIYVEQTKTNKAYITPMSPALSTTIKEFIKMWRSDARNEDFLFANVGEMPLTVDALKHSIRKYNLDRDVERTSVHALRHTFAKNWIRNTGDVFRLQKLLGHSTLEMTRNYVNMFDEDLKEGFETYNPLDNLKKNASRTQKIKKNT